MIAIEFTAQVTDSTIEFPEAHRGRINGTVCVIVLMPENIDRTDMIDELLTHPLQITDFNALGLVEANERSWFRNIYRMFYGYQRLVVIPSL